MTLGIESSISDTAKAFQSNPQALQQRYAQKQDLFDLLALNMIKKQQAAAKNTLAMSQENKPGTLLEQMEKQVLGNAKEEMSGNTQTETAEGVAGALNTKNAQAKSNMQKIAGSGVAANSANNMRTLAGGGIVGFAAGKEVESKGVMYSMNAFGKVTNYKKVGDEFFRVKKDGTLAKEAVSGGLVLNHLNQGAASPLVEKLGADVAAPFAPIPGAGDMETRDQTSLTGGARDAGPAVDIGLQEALRKQKIAANTQPEEKSPMDIMQGGTPRNDTGGIPNALTFDPKKAEAEVTTDPSVIRDVAYEAPVMGQNVKDIQGLTEKGITSLLTENKDRTAFTDEIMGDRRKLREDVEGKLQNRGLMASLLGAQGSTLGSTMRTSGLAGIAADKEADALKLGGIEDINKLGMDEFNKLADIKQKGVDAGQKYTKSEKDFSQKNSTQNLLADVNNQAKDMAAFKVKSNERLAMYDAKTKKELAVVENGLMKDRIDVQKEANSITKTNGERQGAIHILENQSKNKEVAITKARALLAKQLTNVLQFAGLEDKEIEDKKNKMKKDSEDYINKISAEYDKDIALARKIIKGLDGSNVMSAEDFRKKYAPK